MSDAGIALLVLAIIALVIAAIVFLFRFFGVYHLASCFASSEERAVLTKNEQYNGYMVGDERISMLDLVSYNLFYKVRHRMVSLSNCVRLLIRWETKKVAFSELRSISVGLCMQ